MKSWLQTMAEYGGLKLIVSTLERKENSFLFVNHINKCGENMHNFVNLYWPKGKFSSFFE